MPRTFQLTWNCSAVESHTRHLVLCPVRNWQAAAYGIRVIWANTSNELVPSTSHTALHCDAELHQDKSTPPIRNIQFIMDVPRPSSYPLLGPKYPLLGTIYPQLRVQGRSWFIDFLTGGCDRKSRICVLGTSWRRRRPRHFPGSRARNPDSWEDWKVEPPIWYPILLFSNC